MHINIVSTAAPIVATKSATPATNSAKSVSKTTTSTSATPPSASTASSAGKGQSAPPPPSAASAVSAAISSLVSSTYSTSVGGKSYSANISQANGTYSLSVPNLPGASVSGSSLSAAESALTVKIDTLV